MPHITPRIDWASRAPLQPVWPSIKVLIVLKVIKINPSNGRFSWSHFKVSPSLARLDRCFVNLIWIWRTIYPITTYTFLSRVTSDHNPLKIEVLQHQKLGKGTIKPFRFENLWYSYPDLESIATHGPRTLVSKTERPHRNLSLEAKNAHGRTWSFEENSHGKHLSKGRRFDQQYTSTGYKRRRCRLLAGRVRASLSPET